MTSTILKDKRPASLAALLLELLAVSPARAQVVEYYHTDAIGNVRAITDASGNVIERHDYQPYGEEWLPQGGTQPLRFTGKERDAETGLDYFGARYYGSRIGRFSTVDPVYNWKENLVDPQRWNRYAYARNNPLRYIDPDGKDVVLAVRNNSGGGFTNFGHTAIRVVGEGYDRTYDFGRYGATWGLMKSEGEGILRVWSDWDAFAAAQAPKGDLRTARYKTSKETDEGIMADFAAQASAGQKRKSGKNFEEYRLQEDYDLRTNNCTTICLGAMGGAQRKTGAKFPGYEGFKNENDPRDLFGDVGRTRGGGVSVQDAKKRPE